MLVPPRVIVAAPEERGQTAGAWQRGAAMKSVDMIRSVGFPRGVRLYRFVQMN